MEQDKLKKEIEDLKEKMASQQGVNQNVETLEAQIEELKNSEANVKSENTKISAEFEKKKKEAD